MFTSCRGRARVRWLLGRLLCDNNATNTTMFHNLDQQGNIDGRTMLFPVRYSF